MKNKRFGLLTLAALLLALLLSACGNSSVALTMRETHIFDQWKASYTSFTGVKTHSFRADAGQTLVITYDVQVDKGALSLRVKNWDGASIWEAPLQADQADTVSVALEQGGRYTIAIEGERTSGDWDVSWDLQE